MSDLQGKLVKDFDEALNAGDFWWTGEPPLRLNFVCPCGCGSVGGVSVRKDENDRGGNHPIWGWNENKEQPTIQPSIKFVGGCGWHGFLTNGIFKTV